MTKKEIEFRDPIIEKVVDKIVQRSDVGFKKYKVTLKDDLETSLDGWLTHLQDELMDAVNYIEKCKDVLKTRAIEVVGVPSDRIKDLEDENKELERRILFLERSNYWSTLNPVVGYGYFDSEGDMTVNPGFSNPSKNGEKGKS